MVPPSCPRTQRPVQPGCWELAVGQEPPVGLAIQEDEPMRGAAERPVGMGDQDCGGGVNLACIFDTILLSASL